MKTIEEKRAEAVKSFLAKWERREKILVARHSREAQAFNHRRAEERRIFEKTWDGWISEERKRRRS